jgi:hypothetical protein
MAAEELAMLLTTAAAYSIRLIDDISRSDAAACITFRDGFRAPLEFSQRNSEQLLWLAEWSRGSRPVGVVTDPVGRILDLNVAHETGVAWVREFPTDRSRFRVAFWAYSPLCGLTREHPEFDRIYATLTAAAGKPGQLWVATHSEETVEDEPDEDGVTAALPESSMTKSNSCIKPPSAKATR